MRKRREGMAEKLKADPRMVAGMTAAEVGEAYGIDTESALRALRALNQRDEIIRDEVTRHRIVWRRQTQHWAFRVVMNPRPPKVFGERCYVWD